MSAPMFLHFNPLTIPVFENQLEVGQLIAQDEDLDTLTYSIAGGLDSDKFTVDQTGVLSFIERPDFENPTAALSFLNIYNVVVQVTDGSVEGGIDTQEIFVEVHDDIGEPTITSDGSQARAEVLVQENTTAVTNVTATDPDIFQGLSYSIDPNYGDANQFTIDSATGALSFQNAPDYENPTDFDNGNGSRDNAYDVRVIATNVNGGDPMPGVIGIGTDWQDILVRVQDVDDNIPPEFSSFGGDPGPVLRDVLENTTEVATVTATDQDAGDSITYSIDPSVGDAGKFTVDQNGGLSFINAPDFENPTDIGGGDNVYDVGVLATDENGATDRQDFRIFVQDDLSDNPPVDQVLTGSNKLNDTLVGGEGNDTINGLKGNDNLVGHGGNDAMHGGDGVDIISAGPGSNSVDGGAGQDYMLLSGERVDYGFAFNKKGVLTGITGPDGGITSVKGIEVFHFEGGANFVVSNKALVETSDATINPLLASRGVDSTYYDEFNLSASVMSASEPDLPLITHSADWLVN